MNNPDNIARGRPVVRRVISKMPITKSAENTKSRSEIMNEIKEYNERRNFETVFQNVMQYHEIKNKEDAKKNIKPFFPTWNHKGRQEQVIEHFNYYFKMTHDEKGEK